jgi:hypothetical protein
MSGMVPLQITPATAVIDTTAVPVTMSAPPKYTRNSFGFRGGVGSFEKRYLSQLQPQEAAIERLPLRCSGGRRELPHIRLMQKKRRIIIEGYTFISH